jgi:hypothetical protein
LLGKGWVGENRWESKSPMYPVNSRSQYWQIRLLPGKGILLEARIPCSPGFLGIEILDWRSEGMLSDHPVALELGLSFEILGVPQLVEGDWKELWMGR